MQKTKAFLKDWIINFVKHKDIFTKSIDKIEYDRDGFDIVVHYKDQTRFFICTNHLENLPEMMKKFNEDDRYGIVTINSHANFKKLIEHWKELSRFKMLCIYLINPFSNLDKKWLIYPHTHSRIADEASLELGLKSMFETVEPINHDEIENKL